MIWLYGCVPTNFWADYKIFKEANLFLILFVTKA